MLLQLHEICRPYAVQHWDWSGKGPYGSQDRPVHGSPKELGVGNQSNRERPAMYAHDNRWGDDMGWWLDRVPFKHHDSLHVAAKQQV